MTAHLKQQFTTWKRDFWQIQRYNIQTFRRQPLAEISGSVGDIGTLLPIMIALTTTKSISLSSTLVFSGLANILTGVFFGIPLPVQPMKAIAAVAIAREFSPAETASAGLFVAGAVGFLSLTGLMHWFTNRIPIPVVKGIQVGTGLSLIMSAGNLYHHEIMTSWIMFLAFLALLASARWSRVPYALIILLIGVLFAVFFRLMGPVGTGHEDYKPWPDPSIWNPSVLVPSPASFSVGMFEAGIGQLPLTTLNSVIAVSFLASDLLPDIKTASTTSLGLSVMAINMVSCWFGSMPVCHGSGGLAAQYRFGARSGASIIFLGLVKLLLGLFASEIALMIFWGFPNILLCILLIAAGLELAKVGESLNTSSARDLSPHHDSNHRQDEGANDDDEIDTVKSPFEVIEKDRQQRWAVMLWTVAGILSFRNDAVGFAAGMLCHWSYRLFDKLDARVAQREGRIRLIGRESPGPEP